MRFLRTVIPAIAISFACSLTAIAQTSPQISPEDKASNDVLDATIKAAPLLSADRVELKVPLALGLVSAVAADAAGNVYILQRSADVDPVVVVDPSGKVIRSWGKGDYQIPHSIHIDPKGAVWTTDARTSKIVKYAAEGKKLLEIDVGGIPDAKRSFCGVTGVAFAAGGNVFVSDGYCNARVIEFSADGKRLREWGAAGKGQGQFILPHDIAAGSDGTLYVADRENGRVQWFDASGNFLGEKQVGGRLYSIAVRPDGRIYLGAGAKSPDRAAGANVFRFDPRTGVIDGRMEIIAHETEIGADGAIYAGHGEAIRSADGKTSTVVFLRPRN